MTLLGTDDGQEPVEELSPYAWMSVRDGELIRTALQNVGAALAGSSLRVVEWGAGRSTLSYSAILARAGIPFRWLALEYDRAFCERDIAPELLARPGTRIRYVDSGEIRGSSMDADADADVEVVCWNRQALRPFLGAEHCGDRLADLDDYVDYPLAAGIEADVVLVDGRKRRRCLLTARDLLVPRGLVLLHDAFREYYSCAMREYPVSRRIGDELWIGAHAEAALGIALPDLPDLGDVL